jgi:hypothetical protein
MKNDGFYPPFSIIITHYIQLFLSVIRVLPVLPEVVL